uniref:Uncharacterized protein n=1 Tax=Alexandrium monilatum TaxID=311494 RepID=A0A6T0S7Q2_9DINO|mmetsp:Transcript_114126/g.363870  ORF Transcript_114126/g.363870 Transcript_114126/m.363870 type:complete len:240 (-) Transcript_114126:168-887(-)
MPVAGVASARARMFEQGFGGLVLEDEDYSKQAHVPGVVVKVRGDTSVKLNRVPLPERFRCNGHQRHCKSVKKQINGEIEAFGEENNVTGKPQQRITGPQPLPAGAVRAAGASSAPVQAVQTNGFAIGENGVVMGVPASTSKLIGPFHQYLSDSLGMTVTGIYYLVRQESGPGRNSTRDSKTVGNSRNSTRMEKLEEGPDGISNYPFVPGMQIFVDIEAELAGQRAVAPQQASCAGCTTM